ncbi:MAG: hypothetical protein VYC27_04670 [Candidatus Thermoplasmatota archaeon]|nr:hypothetical protein [Candidatus Thermoplasmatota archaeon]
MNIEIDTKTALTMIAFVACAALFWYTSQRSTRLLLQTIARPPAIPDIAQIARLEPETGFKVVTSDGFRTLKTQSEAVSELPGGISRLRGTINTVATRLSELEEKFDAVGLRIDAAQARVIENIAAVEQLSENTRQGITAVLDELDGGQR